MDYNPRGPELLAWLDGLPTEDEHMMRCALMTLLRSFRRSGDFRRRAEALRATLNPNEGELAALLQRANRRAAEIREHLAAGETETGSAVRRVSESPFAASRTSDTARAPS